MSETKINPGQELSNPYKFSVYRAAALNSPNNTAAAIAYDTENFDTNSNFDITTNKGRYTVPVSGFYQFNASSFINGNIRANLTLNVDGTAVVRGNDLTGTGGSCTPNISCLVQLTAGQYVELYMYSASAVAFEVSSASLNTFQGFLVSNT